jgi:hypothetical protein
VYHRDTRAGDVSLEFTRALTSNARLLEDQYFPYRHRWFVQMVCPMCVAAALTQFALPLGTAVSGGVAARLLHSRISGAKQVEKISCNDLPRISAMPRPDVRAVQIRVTTEKTYRPS